MPLTQKDDIRPSLRISPTSDIHEPAGSQLRNETIDRRPGRLDHVPPARASSAPPRASKADCSLTNVELLVPRSPDRPPLTPGPPLLPVARSAGEVLHAADRQIASGHTLCLGHPTPPREGSVEQFHLLKAGLVQTKLIFLRSKQRQASRQGTSRLFGLDRVCARRGRKRRIA